MKKKTQSPKSLNFSKGRDVFTSEPKWEKLQQAKTEKERLEAWKECEFFVHQYITPREYIHSAKKWVRDFTDWNIYPQILEIPDPFLGLIAKDGWKAYVLGYMPLAVEKHFKKELFSMLERVESLRARMLYEPPIHPSISLAEDNELHPAKVKQWIEYWKKWLRANKALSDKSEYQTAKCYVQNMQTYLTSGVWLDSRYGEKREQIMYAVCVAPAYDKDGLMKRTVGVYYRDLGCVWTKEMRNDYARIHG